MAPLATPPTSSLPPDGKYFPKWVIGLESNGKSIYVELLMENILLHMVENYFPCKIFSENFATKQAKIFSKFSWKIFYAQPNTPLIFLFFLINDKTLFMFFVGAGDVLFKIKGTLDGMCFIAQ